MDGDYLRAHTRQIITAMWIFFVLIILWVVGVYISHIGKLPLVISAVPSSAKVTIDGKSYSSGTSWVTPGTYKVSVSEDGYDTQTKTAIVTADKQQNVIAASLTPESDKAKSWAAKHSDDYTKNQDFGAIEASNTGDYLKKLHPITDKLPFVDPYFTVSYSTNQDQSIKLIISTPSPRYRYAALQKIRDLGFDPTDFTIEFKDFKNPLEQK